MGKGGYTGKILRIDLTAGKVSSMDSAPYQQFGGGHGMGSAVFFDLCTDKTVDGFDPKNVVTIMTSPLSGSPSPAVAGRTEVQAIGVHAYPKGWFTRSNFGGRFSAMLKYAGWDGIVIEGKSEKPVWIDIRNGDVAIQSAEGVWGLDTVDAQREIWKRVQGEHDGNWVSLGTARDEGRTTQRPAVLTIAPSGETLSRMASLVHDAGNGAGQGGFGAVFGSKNLKAVSVIGTGGVPIADATALVEARAWAHTYAVAGHWDDYDNNAVGANYSNPVFPGRPGIAANYGPADDKFAPQGCLGCHKSCRRRRKDGISNGSSCLDMLLYFSWDKKAHGKMTWAVLNAADIVNRAALNSFEIEAALLWIMRLYNDGIVGPGKQIPSSLPFDKIGETEFITAFIKSIVDRTDIGADLHEGLARCALKWGRYEQDVASGILPLMQHGTPQHYDGRTETEWGFGSMIGDRDINEHDFNCVCYWEPSKAIMAGQQPPVSAEQLAEIMGEKLEPYNDPMMIDYSNEGMYSDSMVKLVAWHRHYTRFWKESILYCDWAWGDYANSYGPNNRGLTGQAEQKFLNAVTGGEMTFAEGMEIGRKIWTLDRAIWALQGRVREDDVLGAYMYGVPATPGFTTFEVPYYLPMFVDGKWVYGNAAGRFLDREKCEDFKTRFYAFEGWDEKNGVPTRKTLEELELGKVAEELEKAGVLS